MFHTYFFYHKIPHSHLDEINLKPPITFDHINWCQFHWIISYWEYGRILGRFTFEQIYFMKERRTIRQKSGCLNHLNEQIFQVNINDSLNGGSEV